MRNSRPRVHYTFRHVSDTFYDIIEYGAVSLCVRAYGIYAFVVDKHRTTMVSKQTTNIDRFDFLQSFNENGEEADYHWFRKTGPHQEAVPEDLNTLLNKMVEHHTNYIARIIVE